MTSLPPLTCHFKTVVCVIDDVIAARDVSLQGVCVRVSLMTSSPLLTCHFKTVVCVIDDVTATRDVSLKACVYVCH